jgi:glycosyltransferase involved in cell wall biosynthesis
MNSPISMVMVSYNEQDHIEKTVREYYEEIFVRLPKGSEFIIYLDAPTDETPSVINRLSKELDIKPIYAKKNLGYAGAMTTALLSTKSKIIFYSDSSGKHKANDFWKLLPFISHYDIVTGLRKPRTDPYIRQFVTMGQRVLISSMFLMPLYDFNTGFKLLKREVIDSVLPECKYMNQSFSSEFLIRAYKRGFKIKNVPVIFIGREKRGGTRIGNLPRIISRSFRGYLRLFYELNLKNSLSS